MGGVQRNCRHCNGRLALVKKSASFYMGNCVDCKATFALVGEAAVALTQAARLAKASRAPKKAKV